MLRCCVITLIIRHPRLRTKLHVTPSHDTRHWEKLWICQNLCDHNEAGLHWTLDTGVKFDPYLLLVAGDSCLPLQACHHWRFCSTLPFGGLKQTLCLAQHNQNEATICHFVQDGFYTFHIVPACHNLLSESPVVAWHQAATKYKIASNPRSKGHS